MFKSTTYQICAVDLSLKITSTLMETHCNMLCCQNTHYMTHGSHQGITWLDGNRFSLEYQMSFPNSFQYIC